MENGKKTVRAVNKAFRAHYMGLEKEERRLLRQRIQRECKVNYFTVNNWLYSNTIIKPLVLERVEKIIGKKLKDESARTNRK